MSTWQKGTSSEFRQLLTTMGQRKVPSNTDGFDEEFEVLRAVDMRVRTNTDEFYSASLGSNMCKNRYQDVLPNEGTRVVLEPTTIRGDGGDYINANYVDGRRLYGVPFVYIATQAPVRSTLVDFWRMVWENNSAFIVMLCKEVEGGKNKCIRYFPDTEGGYLTCGPLTVLLESENRREETVFRRILLRNEEGQERRVFHMQHVTWPDQSIPKSSAGLMDMIYALGKSILSTQTPIVVHCSGGVGRTGVFIGMHVALALFQTEKPISIPRIVQYLKYCRTGMVQRKDQYLFLYYAVLREMEKIVWAFEHKGSSTATAALVEQQLERSNTSVARRANSYTPAIEGQAAVSGAPPMMDRSKLFPVGGMHSYGGREADHGIVRGHSVYGGATHPPLAPGPRVGRPDQQDDRQRRELERLMAGHAAPVRSHSQAQGYYDQPSHHQQQSYHQPQPEQQQPPQPQQYSVSRAPSATAYRADGQYDGVNASGVVGPSAAIPDGPRNPIQEQLAILQERNQRRRGTMSTPASATRGSVAPTPSRPPPVLHRTAASAGNSHLLKSFGPPMIEDTPPPAAPAPSSALRANSAFRDDHYAAPPHHHQQQQQQQQQQPPASSSYPPNGGGPSGSPLFASFNAPPQPSPSYGGNTASGRAGVSDSPNPEAQEVRAYPQPAMQRVPSSAAVAVEQPPSPAAVAQPISSSSVSSPPRSNLVAKVVGTSAQPALSSAMPITAAGAQASGSHHQYGGAPAASVAPEAPVKVASPVRPQKYFFSPDEEEAAPQPAASLSVRKRDKDLL